MFLVIHRLTSVAEMEWEISESYRAAKEAAVRRKYDQSALFLRTALSLIERRLNALSTDDSNRDQFIKVRVILSRGGRKPIDSTEVI